MSGIDENLPAHFPALAISDLLVLTLTVGTSMACIAPEIRDLLAVPVSEWAIPRWRGIVPEIADYMAIGVALFGLIVLARQRLRGSHHTTSPGHWIFIAIGPFMMLLLGMGLLRQFVSVEWTNRHLGWRSVRDGTIALVLAISVLAVLPRVRSQVPRWRVCLLLILLFISIVAVIGVCDAANVGGDYWLYLNNGAVLVFLAALTAACVAIAIDVAQGVRRDWLHYCAIAMLAIYAVSTATHYQ